MGSKVEEFIKEPDRARGIRGEFYPLNAIQGIVAIALFGFGVWLASPYYVPASGAATNAFSADVQRVGFSIIMFVAPALTTIIGFFNSIFRTPKWRARGCLWMSIGIFFITFLRIVAVGVNPPIWVFYLATGLITGTLYLYWRLRV